MRALFDKVRNKLLDQRGDSIAEVLVAILIAALGASLLATMVMASTNVAMSSQQALDASYEAESSLFAHPSSGSGEYATISIPGESGTTATTIKAAVYQYDGFAFYEEVD